MHSETRGASHGRDHSGKINILFLIDEFIDSGGTERHVLQLAAGLDRNRYDVVISPIHDGDTRMIQSARAQGIPVRPFVLERMYGPSAIPRTLQLVSFLAQNRVHIVQTYHFVSDIWGSLAARWAGVPIVISNRRDKGFKEKSIHKLLRTWSRRRIDLTVCVSDDLARQLRQQEKWPETRLHTVYNGVDAAKAPFPDTLRQKRTMLGWDSGRVIIGSVMNYRPVKGIDYLIEAAARIRSRIPNVLFVCVGGDANSDSMAYKSRLLQKIAALGLNDHFAFLGKRRDVWDLLHLFDHFVHPSLSEGFSNALIEAMQAGKSIVATKVGGNGEAITDGVHGLLVPPADAEALAQALLRLIEDPGAAIQFARNARHRAETVFTSSRMITQYDELYQKRFNLLN